MPENHSNNTKWIAGLLLLIIIGAIVTFFVVRSDQNDIDDNAIAAFSNDPEQASYTDLNGNEISLEQYLGNILVVNSWASWSPFSATDLPILQKLAGEFNSDAVTFMGINRKETKEQAARFINTMPDLNNLVLVLDPRDHFYTSVGGYAMPEVVIYNQKGTIIEHFRGDANEEKIRETVTRLLPTN